MDCVRAMSSVCPGTTFMAIGRSGFGNGAGDAASFRGRIGSFAPPRLHGSQVRGGLQGVVGLKGFAWPRGGGVRASSSGIGMTPSEPLDSKADKAASEAEGEFDSVKQSIGSSVDSAKETASDVLDDSKQSFASTVDKKRAGETKSLVEDTASKELEKLKDITNQLLEQAEIARQKLAATAQETAYKQKDNLAYVAENGPEPVKEVAGSALNAHYSNSGKSGSKIHDFCLGIPFGILLAGGGLLWFIISGGTSAIRFGVILGSALLYLSVTSLKKWKNGESSMPYIQGQAAISAFLFLRYYRRFTVNKLFFPTDRKSVV